MKKIDIVRAWKDTEYRNTLTAAERAALPPSPAGELADDDLAMVAGGVAEMRTHRVFSLGCPCSPKLSTTATLCCPK